MYHEVTYKDMSRRRRRRVVVAVCAVIFAVILGLAINVARAGAREQGAVALRKAIMDAAIRCCAVEGSYPLSLSHLEQDYGLRINHSSYVVTYEAFASNLPPTVVVVPR